MSRLYFLLIIPQLRYQVIYNIRVAHQMQPEVFVVKHTTDVRVIEYLQGSVGRYVQRIGKLCYDACYFVP